MSKSTAISVRSRRVFLASFVAVTGALSLLAQYEHRSTHALAAGGHGQIVVRPDGVSNGTPGLTSFDVTGAGTVGLQGTAAVGIDAAGDVAGTYIDSNKVHHGFVRSAGGTITAFDAPGAGTNAGHVSSNEGTVVVNMNSAGDVAGYYIDATVHGHGFIRSAVGVVTTIDAPGANQNSYGSGTTSTAVNMAGVSTGYYLDAQYIVHSFVRSAAGSFTPFDAPGANYTGTQTYSINAGGDVTGSYIDSTTGIRHGFVRLANSTLTAFTAPGAVTTTNQNSFSPVNGTLPLSINTGGDITGVYTDSSKLAHGFVRLANGTFTSFDAPNAGKTANVFTGFAVDLPGTGGVDINDSGTVTGVYMDANSVAHGFVRTASGTISVIDAANAGAGAGGYMGTIGVRINAAGVVAGTYFDSNMVAHGFVVGGPSTVTVAVTPASSSVTTTQSLSVTVATSGGGATPTGTVVLASGSYTSAATALSGGSATITIPAGSLAPGTDTLTATYTPDAGSTGTYVGATGTGSVTVTSSATALVLTANPTSGAFGQQIALTATLSPYMTGANTTNGETVLFYSGSTSLGTGALSSGVASLNLTSLPVGTDSLTAVYAGDTNLAGSTSNAVSFVVSGAAPTIAFSVPNHATGDAPFTVAATSNSTGAFTYSVVSGPATIVGSTVTLTGAGTVVLQASQAAAGNFAAGTQNATFTVAGQAQTITFAAPASPVNYGVAPIALSASSSSGLAVRFSVLSGPATVSGSTLSITGAGTVVVAADQAGNTVYSPATEVTHSITVNPIASTLGLSASVSTILVKNAVVLTATVATGAGTPTGTVTFLDGSTSLGTATVAGGVASLSVTTLAAGTHTITAMYGGDTNFIGASSAAITETVQDFTLGAPATTSQTVSAGATAMFTFPITVSGGTTLPTAVTFSQSGAPVGSTVTFNPASLAAGSAPTNVVMSVATPAHALLERPGAGLPVVAFALLLPFVGRKRRRKLGKLAVVLVMLTGLGGAAMLTGCGGNSSSGGGGGSSGPLTYTITVTATSGALTHTSAVTLTVQ